MVLSSFIFLILMSLSTAVLMLLAALFLSARRRAPLLRHLATGELAISPKPQEDRPDTQACPLPGQRWARKQRTPLLVVLGSGGHTAELLRLLRSVSLEAFEHRFSERWYFFPAGDVVSPGRAAKFEAELAEKMALKGAPKQSFRLFEIPRARRVGQSFVTSVFSTLGSLWRLVRLLDDDRGNYAANLRSFEVTHDDDAGGNDDREGGPVSTPRLILCAGPGVCIPVILAARLLNAKRSLLGLRRDRNPFRVWFTESIARVQGVSLTANIVWRLRLADAFCVYWDELAAILGPSARAVGPLSAQRQAVASQQRGVERSSEKSGEKNGEHWFELRPRGGYVLVTVGTTQFDALHDAVADADVLARLSELGFGRIVFQIGTGSDAVVERARRSAPASLGVADPVRFSASFDDLLRGAELVIAHTGAGTVLDCLDAGVPLLTVPNESLMDNHQLVLAAAIRDSGAVHEARLGVDRASPESILNVLSGWCTSPPLFRRMTDELAGGAFAASLEHLAHHMRKSSVS
jgi:UDP-N-acetylglucosamine transferase subunit ALG13